MQCVWSFTCFSIVTTVRHQAMSNKCKILVSYEYVTNILLCLYIRSLVYWPGIAIIGTLPYVFDYKALKELTVQHRAETLWPIL
jgi:hypothetical protein